MEIGEQCFAVTEHMAHELKRLPEPWLREQLAPSQAIAAAVEDGGSTGRAQLGAIAVIPLRGFLTQRTGLFSYGMVSSERFLEAVQSAVADPGVEALVLDIHSPGGGTYGMWEAAEGIRAAREVKPIVSVANSLAGSAAYWLGSQASEFFVTPSGEAGSIGVFGVHVDRSEELAQAGIKVTLIYAGKRKVEGNPVEPLSDAARAKMQADVDRYYGLFVDSVAKGRNASPKAVRGGFGEGAVLGAREAVAEGLADSVGGLADAVRRASRLARRGRTARAQAVAYQRARGA